MIQKYCLKYFLLFFPILFSQNLLSQDSANLQPDSAKIYFFYNNFESDGHDFLTAIDTIITNVENYDPPSKPGNFYATLGNPGLAAENMVYDPVIQSGFKFGLKAFNKYMFTNDSIKYYWVGKPFTHVYFMQGSKKEQSILVDHAQNIASWFTAGVYFRYVNSPGYYANQESDDKNFVFKTRFQTKNYRYMVLANYIHNKLKLEENGGIIYDTVFEDNVIPGRDGIKVNLNSANNYIKENSVFVKHFFKLSKRHRFRASDTTAEKPFLKKINPGNISLSTQYSTQTYLYQQPISDNNGYYRITNDSINGTYDSTHIRKLENRFAWTNGDNARRQLLTFNLMLRHLYIENTNDDSAKNYYSQLIPTGEMSFRISDIIKLYFFGDFVTGNFNVGDFNIKTGINFKWKIGTLSYQLQNASLEPDRFYQSYYSNHFDWNNQFQKQYFLVNRFKYNYKTLWAGVNLFAVKNFVYMDSLGHPGQLGVNLQVFQASIRKLFRLGNWSLDAQLVYQKSSTNDAVRFPDLLGGGSIYYTKDLFKQAAIIQTGVDLFYNTLYNAYAYMPATRSFYIQDKKELGDYLYSDVFFNLQIKRARIFVKYHNLMHVFNDFRYFTVPSYPMKDGGFRFGVSWMFYD